VPNIDLGAQVARQTQLAKGLSEAI